MSLARLAEAGGPGALGVAHPFAPDSAYAVSKIFGEMLGKYHATRDATVARDFEFVALRIGWCAYDDPGALEGTVHDEYLPVRLVGWSHNKSKNKDISHVGNAFVIVRRPADRHILAAHRNEGKQNEGKHPQAHAGVCMDACPIPRQRFAAPTLVISLISALVALFANVNRHPGKRPAATEMWCASVSST